MASFEERLRRLEEISAELKSPELELEKATSLFEEGVKLSQTLEKELRKVEDRIEILINKPLGPDEKPVLEIFPELGDQASTRLED